MTIGEIHLRMNRSAPIALQAEPGVPGRVEAQPGPEVQGRIEAQPGLEVSAAAQAVPVPAAALLTEARTAAPRPEVRIEVPLRPEACIAVRLRPEVHTAVQRQQETPAAVREAQGVPGEAQPEQKPVRALQENPKDGEPEGGETSRISPDC